MCRQIEQDALVGQADDDQDAEEEEEEEEDEDEAQPIQQRPIIGQKRRARFSQPAIPAKRPKLRARSCWPTSTMNQPRRSQALWHETVLKVAQIKNTREFDKTKGIRGIRLYSPLLELEKWGFQIIYSVPAEIMHALDEGVIKLFMRMSFKCKSAEHKKRARGRRHDMKNLNAYLAQNTVPMELPRRGRAFNFASYKASEYSR